MTENVQFLKDLRKMAQMQDQYGQEEPQYWVAGEYRGAASVERNRNISTEYQPNKNDVPDERIRSHCPLSFGEIRRGEQRRYPCTAAGQDDVSNKESGERIY